MDLILDAFTLIWILILGAVYRFSFKITTNHLRTVNINLLLPGSVWLLSILSTLLILVITFIDWRFFGRMIQFFRVGVKLDDLSKSDGFRKELSIVENLLTIIYYSSLWLLRLLLLYYCLNLLVFLLISHLLVLFILPIFRLSLVWNFFIFDFLWLCWRSHFFPWLLVLLLSLFVVFWVIN